MLPYVFFVIIRVAARKVKWVSINHSSSQEEATTAQYLSPKKIFSNSCQAHVPVQWSTFGLAMEYSVCFCIHSMTSSFKTRDC